MIFSYNWLKDYTKLPKPEKLAELLTMHSFEVEDLKKVKSDWVLDIDILPNRAPDCFSHLGVAREAAVITGSKFEDLKIKLKEDKKLKSNDFVSVEVRAQNDCPRYTARVVAGVEVGPSPKWIQERLKACGLRPINNIVDIANYVMLETGQPLHAFDFDKIEGSQPKKIIIRRAEKGEKIISLDGDKYDLDENILIIADEKSPLAVAGIKGGKKAEIDKKTKTIVLESANFEYSIIRRASKKLGLKTDASRRFENGIDSNLTEKGIIRAAQLISETAGGEIASGINDFYPKKRTPKKVLLNPDYVRKLLGIEISTKEMRKILERLGFKVRGGGEVKILVEIPTFRMDISLPEDLIEEIGRIYGYERIPSDFPIAALIPPKKNFDIFWDDIAKNILKEADFREVYNYSFIGDREAENFSYSAQEIIKVENPISLDYKYLRPSLIPNLVKNVESNFRYFDEIKIFELGRVFLVGKSPARNSSHSEKRMLAGVIASKNSREGFYQLKGAVDLLLNGLGISELWYDEYKATPENSKKDIWNPKKSAEIKIGNEEIGFLGEISPELAKKIKGLPSGSQGVVSLFDIDFEKLQKLCSEEHEYSPISQHPAAVRDLAILVPLNIRVADVLNKINAVGEDLIRDVDIFDIYQGPEIPQGKKNLAFHIIYQAKDRTLSSEEIDKVQNKIIRDLEKDPEWEVRK